jgi:hypothetical protein
MAAAEVVSVHCEPEAQAFSCPSTASIPSHWAVAATRRRAAKRTRPSSSAASRDRALAALGVRRRSALPLMRASRHLGQRQSRRSLARRAV